MGVEGKCRLYVSHDLSLANQGHVLMPLSTVSEYVVPTPSAYVVFTYNFFHLSSFNKMNLVMASRQKIKKYFVENVLLILMIVKA